MNCTKLLLRFGAYVNKEMYDACRESYKDILQILLNKRADANALTRFGVAGLIAESEGAHYHTIEFLIEKEACVNQQGIDGNTLLHVACYVGSFCCVKRLTLSGAKVDILNGKKNETPLQIAKE